MELRPQTFPLPTAFKTFLARNLTPETRKRLAGVRYAAAFARARLVLRNRRPAPGPVVVAGLLRSVLGVGEGARLSVLALRDLDLDHRSIDLSPLFPIHDRCDFNDSTPPCEGEGGPVILYLNPRELPYAIVALGRNVLARRWVVGHWVWELPRIPSSWDRALRLVDELWVPSRFVLEAIGPTPSRPMRIVPYPVREIPASRLSREDFGLPQRKTVFLVMADVLSSLTRKNPMGAVQAFARAFGSDDQAELVVKIHNADQAPEATRRLRSQIEGVPHVRLWTASLSAEDIGALVNTCDAVISLHRAEGFGLVPAQAMLAGKPVIATGWSGNVDFMSRDNSLLVDFKLIPVADPERIYTGRGQVWAEPDLDHAAAHLRRLAADDDYRRALGERARQEARQTFDASRFRHAVESLLPGTN